MVRIEPRTPPPPINFLEWDGLIRLCFGRKNRTLGAIFKQPTTLSLLHRNHEVVAAIAAAASAPAAPGHDRQAGGTGGGAVHGAVNLPSAMMLDDDAEASGMDVEDDAEEGMDIDGVPAVAAKVW